MPRLPRNYISRKNIKMPRLPRNYIAEVLSLGGDLRSIAKELKTTKKQISAWEIGLGKPPKRLYEKVRNISRRTTYKYLRQAGYPSAKASSFRRIPHPEAAADVDWLNMVVDTLYNDWNFSYRAYMANPEAWIAAHPNKKIPTEISRDEVKRRIEQGIKNGKSKEEIENY